MAAAVGGVHVVSRLLKHNCTFAHKLPHKMAITAAVMKLTSSGEPPSEVETLVTQSK